MNNRTLMAILLMLAIVGGFETFWLGPQRKRRQDQIKARMEWEKRQRELAEAQAGETPNPESPDGGTPDGNPSPSPEAPDAPPEAPEQTSEVEAPNYHASFSNRGAALTALEFTEIKNNARTARLQPLHLYHQGVRSLGLELETEPGLNRKAWELSTRGDSLVYRFDLGGGRAIEKVITATESFHLNVELRFMNDSGELWSPSYTLNGPAGFLEEYHVRSEELMGVACYKDPGGAFVFKNVGVSSVRSAEGSLQDFTVNEGDGKQLAYVGLNSKYFASVLAPLDEVTHAAVSRGRVRSLLQAAGLASSAEDFEAAGEAIAKSKVPSEELFNQLVAQVVCEQVAVPAGGAVSHSYMLFCGPKESVLTTNPPYESLGFYKLRDYGFGFFSLPAKMLAWLLGVIYAVVGNYGWAIIVLTFIVKATLHPLTRATHISTARMRLIQPEMQKIRDKYEGQTSQDAKQKMTMETFALYRKHKVNPVAGCLPMFVQVPIFFALYNVLNYSYELRQAPFLLWIDDLSQQDELPWRLPFDLPFHGTDIMSVLPIIIIVLYYFNSRLQPTPADPQQAEMQKMFKYMLPALGYLFYTMPSGLVLYFIINVSLGMVEQTYVKGLVEKMEQEKKDAPVVPVTKGGGKGKKGKKAAKSRS